MPSASGAAVPYLESSPLSREQRLWQWRILVSTYFAYAGYYLCRKVFSIAKTSLAGEFHVGLDAIAHVWTAYLVAYLIGQFVNSFVGRRWGPRLLLLGGLGISIAINVVFGFANSYATFLVFMFFNGLVQASGWPGCVGAVSQWLRRRERGTIMGIWSTNYLVGNIMVKSLGGWLLAAYGWRHAFFGCTLIAFGIWWLIWLWQRTKPQDVGLQPVLEEGTDDLRVVSAADGERASFREYAQLLMSPVILLMGASYFCLKFLRYALDSWLPTFLNLQGFDVGRAAYYSQVFDLAGFAGVILTGWALDRLFRGRWAVLCCVLGVGMVAGYLAVVAFGTNPYALALLFGIVGFMLYGPDTILGGAAAVQVAGERNGVAVAGIVNGLGSIGPIVQEEVIGRLIESRDLTAGIRNANMLALSMSVLFVVMMAAIAWYMRLARRKRLTAPATEASALVGHARQGG